MIRGASAVSEGAGRVEEEEAQQVVAYQLQFAVGKRW